MTTDDTRSSYAHEDLRAVRALCLYVATRLGDLLEETVIVGGLAPSLLVGDAQARGIEPHAGTKDMDMGLALRLLEAGRYAEIAARLKTAGFAPDVNDRGRKTHQRWRHAGASRITIDFLIPPPTSGERGGDLKHLDEDFAAIVTPGLDLAFHDRWRVTIEGETVLGERARREVLVADVGALIVLKALAFRGRGREKDAYDLDWLLSAYPGGPQAIALRFLALPATQERTSAIRILREDFGAPDAVGVLRAAAFLGRSADLGHRADVARRTADFLATIHEVSP